MIDVATRQVEQHVRDNYGIRGSLRVSPQRSSLRQTFRVENADATFALRLHPTEEQAQRVIDEVRLLMWLVDHGARVTAPVLTREGSECAPITDIDGFGLTTLSSWLPGAPLGFGDVADALALGQALANFHAQSDACPCPPQAAEPASDQVAEMRATLMQRAPAVVSRQLDEFLRRLEGDLIRGAAAANDVGVTHGDVLPNNALRTDDGVWLIDFEDCAVAPRASDLASHRVVALAADPRYWNAFLDGYRSARKLSEADLAYSEPLARLRGLHGMTKNLRLCDRRGVALPDESWLSFVRPAGARPT